MNEIDQSKNQTFGDMVLTFQNDGRNLVNAWNTSLKAGQLSPAEYRKKINNLNEYTGILAGSAKTFDARIEEVMKRQQEGTASTFELELLNDFGSLSEMKDAKFNISQDGSIMYSKIDPKTGEITGELKDVRALNLPQNIQDNKIVLTDAAKELTKNWEPYELFKDEGGGKTLTVSQVPTSSGTTAFIDFADVTWTSATITARGALIYNSTQSNAAVAILDFGSDKTSTAGTFTIVFPTADATDAIIRIA